MKFGLKINWYPWKKFIKNLFLGEAKIDSQENAILSMESAASHPVPNFVNIETARETRNMNCTPPPAPGVLGIPTEWLLTSGDGVSDSLQETVVIRSNYISALPVLEVIQNDPDPLNFDCCDSCPDH